jgi:hypothetical protein
VPVEFIGLARDLIRRVDRTDTKVVTVLAVCSLPLIGRKNRRQTLRSECLAEAARHWRMEMPAFGRLRAPQIDLGPKHLKIEELRTIAATTQWKEWPRLEEPGLSLDGVRILADDRDIDCRMSGLVNVSMHALGRRYERGGDRCDDAVMADLHVLALARDEMIRQLIKSEFKISAGAGF